MDVGRELFEKAKRRLLLEQEIKHLSERHAKERAALEARLEAAIKDFEQTVQALTINSNVVENGKKSKPKEYKPTRRGVLSAARIRTLLALTTDRMHFDELLHRIGEGVSEGEVQQALYNMSKVKLIENAGQGYWKLTEQGIVAQKAATEKKVAPHQ